MSYKWATVPDIGNEHFQGEYHMDIPIVDPMYFRSKFTGKTYTNDTFS